MRAVILRFARLIREIGGGGLFVFVLIKVFSTFAASLKRANCVKF